MVKCKIQQLKYFLLFSEDILKRADAIWPSPDGNKLVYATFNDTEVQQVRWKVYEDTSDGNLDPYPKEKTMYYPKVSISLSFYYIKRLLYMKLLHIIVIKT